MNKLEAALRTARNSFEDAQAHMARARARHKIALEALQESEENLIRAGMVLATNEDRLRLLERYNGPTD